MSIDEVRLAFDPSSLIALNAILGLVLFGVALDLEVADFLRVVKSPRAPLVGIFCQVLVLPALTFALIPLLAPTPSMALGMLLIAACPGGNVSNFLAHWARADVSTSVSMTALSTAAALVSTPLNLAFWGGLRPDTAALLSEVALDPLEMAKTVAMLLIVPVAVGMTVASRWPAVAERLRKPMQIFSLVAFGGFVAVAFAGNFQHFVAWIGLCFGPVLILNACALALGYAGGTAAGCTDPERKALALEVGIQNTGLGLILVFNFFDGLGGMAVMCAWWGIWHIIAGLTVASLCRRTGLRS